MVFLNTSSQSGTNAKVKLSGFVAPILPVATKVSQWLAQHVAAPILSPVLVPGHKLYEVEVSSFNDSGIVL